jgi:hypothetical protein
MTAKYDSRILNGNEVWRFRTKTKQRNEVFSFEFSRYLWLTQKDAINDEPLFRYYKNKSWRVTHIKLKSIGELNNSNLQSCSIKLKSHP